MKRDGGLSHCEISTPLHVQTLRLHICWWHIAEHAHLVLFIMSRHCNPLLLQPLSWREGENKEADQIFPSWFNWISTFSGNLWLPVHKKDQGLGHVDIASLLALIRPLYELLTRSQRPGDAETSSTFRFNPPELYWVWKHTRRLQLCCLCSIRQLAHQSQTCFWVSSFE